jgi:hypothetical protein
VPFVFLFQNIYAGRMSDNRQEEDQLPASLQDADIKHLNREVTGSVLSFHVQLN